MQLTPGTWLGTYEITAAIGAGGMGEVYRARDSKLGREVALKILPEAVVRNPERTARFRREAQVLAALNHPAIAAIYGFEESGATQFLVLELVEGGTLADRLTRGAVSIDEAIAIASQLARALAQSGLVNWWPNSLWDTSAVLPTDSPFGVLLHALAGYDARPSGLQLAFYLGTLLIIGLGTWQMQRRQLQPPARPDALAQAR